MSISSTKTRAALIPLTLALLSLTCATPLTSLLERAGTPPIQSAIDGLPACDSQATDPTWATGTSAFNDGDGVYLKSDCPAPGCVTDYFLVGTTAQYNNWYNVGPVQCPPTGSCSSAVTKLAQTCTTNRFDASTTITGEWNTKLAGTYGLQGSFGYGHDWTTCNTKGNLDTCIWTDNGCHSVWAAEQILTMHGYTRRSCDSPTSSSTANMANSPKRPDGKYTRGMLDFAIPLPGTSYINCDGTCDATYSPGPLPGVDGALVPIPQ